MDHSETKANPSIRPRERNTSNGDIVRTDYPTADLMNRLAVDSEFMECLFHPFWRQGGRDRREIESVLPGKDREALADLLLSYSFQAILRLASPYNNTVCAIFISNCDLD